MNKKIKQKWFILFALLSFVLLTACGGGDTETSAPEENNGGENGGETTNEGSGSEKSASEEPVATLKIGHMNSTDHVQHTVLEEFAKELKEATNGRIDYEIYPGGALASPPESYDAAVTGIADIMWGLQGYTAGKFPLTAAIGLPFIEGEKPEVMSKTLWDLYEALPEVQEEYSDVKVLWLHTGDTYHIATKGKQVKTLEDIKGLKLRATSAEADALIRAWGGTPVSLPMPEFYDAVQKGVIDGGVIPLSTIYDFNLGDVLDYVTLGSFHNAAFFVVMNKDAYDNLPDEDKEILDSLIGERMAVKAGDAFNTSIERATKIIEEKGIEVYELPEEERQKFIDAASAVAENWIKEKESQGLPGQKVYDELVRIAAENSK